MKEVAIFDAKNRLSALIEEVERTGEEVTITRHGKPVAKLAPTAARLPPEARRALVEQMLSRRDARVADAADWKDLVGRKY